MDPHTPEELETAIKAAGALVEKHQNACHSQKAREAFAEVRRLVALRSPETVDRMELERDLHQLGRRTEEQREDVHQESRREL